MLSLCRSQEPIFLEKADNDKINCEIVFKCPELVALIYKNLSNLTDKYNFILTCKTIHNIVKRIIIIPEESVLNQNSFDSESIFIDYTKLTLHCNFLEISPGPIEIHDGESVNNVNKKIKINTKNIKKLYINSDFENWNQVIRKLNSFENIKYLKIAWTSISQNLNFFNYLTTLNPDTIYCDCQETVRHVNNEGNNENWSFPKSIKKFKIKCKSYLWIDTLLEGLSNFKQNEIDFLELIPFSNFACNFTNYWNKFIRLTSYFKRVDITSDFSIYGQEFYNSMQRLSSIDDISKFWLNLKVSIDSSFWNEIQPVTCLKIKLLCILNIVEIINGEFVDQNMANSIYNTLFRMQRLETLMFRFTMTDLGVNFTNFIHSVSKNLKNIQITDCNKMKLVDLQTMAAHLNNLDTLSLHGIESDEITLKEIFELFKSVKVLEVFFKKSFKNSQILDYFKGQKLSDGSCKFIWPKTICLNIYTYYPNKEEFYDFHMIEKIIPRKSGQLIFAFDKLYFEDETDIFRVTLQQSPGCYNHLKVFRNDLYKINPKLGFYEDLLYKI
uniref:F-box domain-containing protein n=1 Tax=Strongyloides venezuelensis TaxID=75913 RepID=A0A0K0FZF6_STRVS